jgi:adenosylcobyric acid synthase
MAGALLVAGTTSDAGKSLLTAGICRWLLRQGLRVAPFKAQNMSNNSFVTLDGGEIGRAQAFQAGACGIEPSVRFNPVLLKPSSDQNSQVIVLGQATGTVSALSYRPRKAELAAIVADTLTGLRAEYDVVVCEGAGSPAEINLRATDIANLGLARAAELPVLVVGDIDRGGVFASMFGTLALLAAQDQALVAGFVVNKFRGDARLLDPGLRMLTQLTGRPVLGTIPYVEDLWMDAEDSLSYQGSAIVGRNSGPAFGSESLRVAVVKFPRMSNATDVEAFAAEPGVQVRLVTDAEGLGDADLVVLPGSKSTVDDLNWLRRRGMAESVLAHAANGRPVLGICGGYQMLGRRIVDEVESKAGEVAGLGLLPVTVTFAEDKTLGRPHGTAIAGGQLVRGYEIHHGKAEVEIHHGKAEVEIHHGKAEVEIHHGRAEIDDSKALFSLPDGKTEGCQAGSVTGTHWHGAFESDQFRRAYLTEAAAAAGRNGFVVAPDTDYAALRERNFDLLGDLVAEHLDTDQLLELVHNGPPPGLPFIPPGAPTIPE